MWNLSPQSSCLRQPLYRNHGKEASARGRPIAPIWSAAGPVSDQPFDKPRRQKRQRLGRGLDHERVDPHPGVAVPRRTLDRVASQSCFSRKCSRQPGQRTAGPAPKSTAVTTIGEREQALRDRDGALAARQAAFAERDAALGRPLVLAADLTRRPRAGLRLAGSHWHAGRGAWLASVVALSGLVTLLLVVLALFKII